MRRRAAAPRSSSRDHPPGRRTQADELTSSLRDERRERRGRAQLDADLAPADLDLDPVVGPAGQRVVDRRLGVAADRDRERAGLGGAVGERQRVADREQLQHDQPGEQQRRDPGEQLDRRLPAIAQPSPRAQIGARRRAGRSAGPGQGRNVDADLDLALPADVRALAQRVRKRAARTRLGIAADQRRPRAGPGRVPGRPERIPDEPDLGRDQDAEQQRRDDGDELGRCLSSFVSGSRGGHAAKLGSDAIREARSA